MRHSVVARTGEIFGDPIGLPNPAEPPRSPMGVETSDVGAANDLDFQ